MILMSSLVFSLLHLNLAQVLHTFFIGVVLSYIVIRTEKIVLPMIIHCVNNVLALFLPQLFPALNNISFSAFNLVILFIIMVLGAIFSISSIHNLLKVSLRDEDNPPRLKDYLPNLFKSILFAFSSIKSIFKKKGLKIAKEDLIATLPKAQNEQNLIETDNYLNSALIGFLVLMLLLVSFS